MTSVSENDLRAWLKTVWKRGESDLGVQWVEPAKGSSVGFPDALLPIWPALIPVELKVAHKNAFDAFTCDVRPVQRRFHLMMEKQNLFSCFLIAEGSKNNFNVWLSHNSVYPWNNSANAGEKLIATNQKASTSYARVVLIHEILLLMNAHNQVLLQLPGKTE